MSGRLLAVRGRLSRFPLRAVPAVFVAVVGAWPLVPTVFDRADAFESRPFTVFAGAVVAAGRFDAVDVVVAVLGAVVVALGSVVVAAALVPGLVAGLFASVAGVLD